jgi:hypothetical protein
MRSITIVTRFEATSESPYLQDSQILWTGHQPISDFWRNVAREVGRLLANRFWREYFDYYAHEQTPLPSASLHALVPWVHPETKILPKKVLWTVDHMNLDTLQTGIRAARFWRRHVLSDRMQWKAIIVQEKIQWMVEYLNLISDQSHPLLVTWENWAKLALGLLKHMSMSEALRIPLPKGSIIHADLKDCADYFRKGAVKNVNLKTDHIPYE